MIRGLLWLLLAVFFHAQWIILVPTAALWVGREIARGRPALLPWTTRRTAIVGILAGVAGAIIVYAAVGSACYDYIYSGGRPHPRQLFLPITTACIGAPYLRYTLFSHKSPRGCIRIPLLHQLPGDPLRDRAAPACGPSKGSGRPFGSVCEAG